MNENRKKIIVKEIQYWKQSHLLPEQYCDYLLALYTEGQLDTKKEKKISINSLLVQQLFHLLFLSISVFVLYFTEYSFTLQIGILAVSVATLLYYFRNRSQNHIAIICSLLIMLMVTVELGSQLKNMQPYILYAITVLNCSLWIGIGKKFQMLYLILSGIAGGILLLISIFV